MASESDALAWLQDWYTRNCDGDWEHDWRVRIGTLDNPGWSVEIHLDRTDLEDRSFPEVVTEPSETDWLHCRVQDRVFRGYAGPTQLEAILRTFRRWAESEPDPVCGFG